MTSIRVYRAGELAAASLFDQRELRHLQEFIRAARAGSLMQQAVASLVDSEGASMEVQEPINEATGYIDLSWNIGNNFNVVRVNGAVHYYMIQLVSFCDGIYLPGLHCAILIDHLTRENILTLERHGAFDERSDGRASLGGFICSHDRPYHYFYDALPAFYEVMASLPDSIVAQLAIVSLKGGDWLSLETVENRAPVFPLDSTALNEWAMTRGEFFVHLGYSGLLAGSKEAAVDDVDAVIKCRYPRYVLPEFTKDALTISFEISREKGWWLDQNDAIPELLSWLGGEINGPIRCLLDGYTFPGIPKESHFQRMQDEVKYAGEIMAKSPEGVVFELLTGKTSDYKIRRYAGVDLFVSRVGTGTLYPSRLYDVPGVVHHGGLTLEYFNIHKLGAKAVSVQGKTVLEDARGSEFRGNHYVPYQLDWRIVRDELANLLPSKGAECANS